MCLPVFINKKYSLPQNAISGLIWLTANSRTYLITYPFVQKWFQRWITFNYVSLPVTLYLSFLANMRVFVRNTQHRVQLNARAAPFTHRKLISTYYFWLHWNRVIESFFLKRKVSYSQVYKTTRTNKQLNLRFTDFTENTNTFINKDLRRTKRWAKLKVNYFFVKTRSVKIRYIYWCVGTLKQSKLLRLSQAANPLRSYTNPKLPHYSKSYKVYTTSVDGGTPLLPSSCTEYSFSVPKALGTKCRHPLSLRATQNTSQVTQPLTISSRFSYHMKLSNRFINQLYNPLALNSSRSYPTITQKNNLKSFSLVNLLTHKLMSTQVSTSTRFLADWRTRASSYDTYRGTFQTYILSRYSFQRRVKQTATTAINRTNLSKILPPTTNSPLWAYTGIKSQIWNKPSNTGFYKVQLKYKKTNWLPKIRFGGPLKLVTNMARTRLNTFFSINLMYQWRLSRFLFRFYHIIFYKLLLFYELRVLNIMLRLRFVPTLELNTLLINSGLLKINNLIIRDTKYSLSVADKLSIDATTYYYIFYKWSLFFEKQRFMKLRLYVQHRRLKAGHKNRFKTKSTVQPKWLLQFNWFKEDVCRYLEVDYTALTCWVMFQPNLRADFTPYYSLFIKYFAFKMYNWKYII